MIRVENFSFAYPPAPSQAEEPVLTGVDWQVAEGSFVLLVGATGSGKSTLLRCCKPEIAPEGRVQGRIEVAGQPVSALTVAESARLVGYVAQDPDNQVVCDAVWHELAFGLENLGFPQDEMRRRIAEVAIFFGLEGMMEASVDRLSGGQKQMLTLASIMALRPRVLLLDEPTAQLDPVAEKNFCHALFRLNRELGVTVVVATHAPEALMHYATELVRMENGRVTQASLEELRAACVPTCAPVTASASEAKAIAAPSFASRLGASAAPALAVTLRDVWFRYDKAAPWVLRAFEATFAAGRVHAIVGGNGGGKTTLMRLIAGALKPAHGKLANACAGRQVILPQDPKALFVCDTVAEELAEWQARFGYDERAIAQAAARAGLAMLMERHPYDLSGGQQQMLAFAKIALTNADLFLLDEPTKGLDSAAKMQVARAIVRLREEGKTVLLVTHDLAFAARVADDVTMVFDGEVACVEPAETFFESNLFFRPPYDGFARLWDECHAQ